MQKPLLLLSLLIFILLFILGIIIKTHNFTDYKEAQSSFVNRQLAHYGNVPIPLIASNKWGSLGETANPILRTSGYKANYPLTPKDGIWKIVEKCESIKTMDCNVFDDPEFSLNCGLCLDIGKNHANAPAIGGLVLLPADKKSARDGNESNFIPEYIPTMGFCPARKMVSTKEECLDAQKAVLCKKNGSFDIPGCSQCYSDGNYTIIDPKVTPGVIAGYGKILVVGSGILTINEEGYDPRTNIILSQNKPFAFNIRATEGKKIKFTVNPPSNSTEINPILPYISGYIIGRTVTGEWTQDLRDIVIIDEVTGNKPRTAGIKLLNAFSTTKMSPGFGQTTMIINVFIPFTFVETTTKEASVCKGSPFITTKASANFLNFLQTDPCYNKESGPGKYSQECLQNAWITNGCTSSGKSYPNDINTNAILMTAEDGSFRTINDISNYIYNLAIITATGVAENGQKQSIDVWSNVSYECTGNIITSPCDLPNSRDRTLSPDCIVYLWNNQGSKKLWNGQNSPIGPTYYTSDAISLFKKGSTLRACQATGTLSPVTPDGSIKNDIVAYWQSKGDLNTVKKLMADLHSAANAQAVSDDQIAPYFTQCYGNINFAKPIPYVPPPPPPSPPSPSSLLCLSHHWSQTPPHVLMTRNGKDWFIPNLPPIPPSGRVFITKLNNIYYLACHSEGAILHSSTDGRNWQPMIQANSRFNQGFHVMGLIAYKNKLYIGMYDKGFFSSADQGNTWTHIDIYASHLHQMKIINNKLYLVNRYSISEFDETTNTSRQISPNFMGGNSSVNQLGYDSDKNTYMIICSLPDQGNPKAPLFYWSNDLVNWSQSTGTWRTGKYSGFNNLTNAFGKWWANGNDASLLVCSEDGGKSWNEVKHPAQSHASLFFFGDTLNYWGMDSPTTQFYSTTDGINWQQNTSVNSLMNGGYLHLHSIA